VTTTCNIVVFFLKKKIHMSI